MVGSILNSFWEFSQNLFSPIISFLSTLLGHLFNGLISVIKFIFQPILILAAILFYFISKLAELFLLLIMVLLSLGKLLYSLVQGLVKTLAGFVWTPVTPDHGSWSGAISEVFIALEPYQLDKVAYIIMFVIWVMTAVAAIRMITSRGDA